VCVGVYGLCVWPVAGQQGHPLGHQAHQLQATSGVVGLTVLQPKFLEQFPNARFHFNSGDGAQRGTFKGVWLNKEHTEWALERSSSKGTAFATPCSRGSLRPKPVLHTQHLGATSAQRQASVRSARGERGIRDRAPQAVPLASALCAGQPRAWPSH
jgi:hypothetical protein